MVGDTPSDIGGQETHFSRASLHFGLHRLVHVIGNPAGYLCKIPRTLQNLESALREIEGKERSIREILGGAPLSVKGIVALWCCSFLPLARLLGRATDFGNRHGSSFLLAVLITGTNNQRDENPCRGLSHPTTISSRKTKLL